MGPRSAQNRGSQALRSVEAIRLHAASQGQALPRALDEIKLVPVPDDPTTGKPFEYKPDGRFFLFAGATPDGMGSGVAYRLSMPK